MHCVRSIALVLWLIACSGFAFQSEHFNAHNAQLHPRTRSALQHKAINKHDVPWQFTRLRASRKAALPSHPKRVHELHQQIVPNTQLYAVKGDGQADTGLHQEPQEGKGFLSKLFSWFTQRTPQEQPAIAVGQVDQQTARTENGKPKMAKPRTPKLHLPTNARKPPPKQAHGPTKSRRQGPPPRTPAQQTHKPVAFKTAPTQRAKISLAQLAAGERYRRRTYEAKFTGAHNDRELEAAVDGYEHLSFVLPFNQSNYAGLQLESAMLRGVEPFPVNIAEVDFNQSKVMLQLPGTGHWFNKLVLHELFWQTAQPGMAFTSGVSQVRPSGVQLKLLDFADVPVFLPFGSLENRTTELFDPSVPGYLYNVTLRVETIDHAKREITWTIQDVRRKEEKPFSWLRLQRLADSRSVSVQLLSEADGTVKGHLVDFPGLNGTLPLADMDATLAAQFTESAHNQSIVQLFVNKQLSTANDVRLLTEPLRRSKGAVASMHGNLTVAFTTAVVEGIVNKSMQLRFPDRPDQPAYMRLNMLPSFVAAKLLEHAVPGTSINVSIVNRISKGGPIEYLSVSFLEWMNYDERKLVEAQVKTISKLIGSTKLVNLRVLKQFGDVLLVETNEFPGVPGWFDIYGTPFMKLDFSQLNNTVLQVPLRVTDVHSSNLGFFATVGHVSRIRPDTFDPTKEYDATVDGVFESTISLRLHEHPTFNARISLLDPLAMTAKRWRETLKPGMKLKLRVVRVDTRMQTIWVVPSEEDHLDLDSPEWAILNSTDPSRIFKARVIRGHDALRIVQLLDHPNITGVLWVRDGFDAPTGSELDVTVQEVSPTSSSVLFAQANADRLLQRQQPLDAAQLANTSTVLRGNMVLHTTRGILVRVPAGKHGRGMISLDRVPSAEAGYLLSKFSQGAPISVRVNAYNELKDDVWLTAVVDPVVRQELLANVTALPASGMPLRADFVSALPQGMLVQLRGHPGVVAFVPLTTPTNAQPGSLIYVRVQRIDTDTGHVICHLVDHRREFISQLQPQQLYEGKTVDQTSKGIVVQLDEFPGFEAWVPMEHLTAEFKANFTGTQFKAGTRLRVLSDSTFPDQQRKLPSFSMEGMDLKSMFRRAGPPDPAMQYDADVVGRTSSALVLQLPQHHDIQGVLPFKFMNDLDKYKFLKTPHALQNTRVQTAEVDSDSGRVLFKSVQLEPPSLIRSNATIISAQLTSETEEGFIVSVANQSGVIAQHTLENATIDALRMVLAGEQQSKEVMVSALPGVDGAYRYHNTSVDSAAATPAVDESATIFDARVIGFDEHGLTIELPSLEQRNGFLLFDTMPHGIAQQWRARYSRGQAVNVTVTAVDDATGMLILRLTNIPPEFAAAREAKEDVVEKLHVDPAALKSLQVGETYKAKVTVLRPNGLVFQLCTREVVTGWLPFDSMVRNLAEYWKKYYTAGMSLSVVLERKLQDGELHFSALRSHESYTDALMCAVQDVPGRVYQAQVTEVVDGLGVHARLEGLGYTSLIPQALMPRDFSNARVSWIFQPGDHVHVKLDLVGDEVVYRLATHEEFLHQNQDGTAAPPNTDADLDVLPDGTMLERWPGYNALVSELATDSWHSDDVPVEEEPAELRRLHVPGFTHRDRVERWVRHQIEQHGSIPLVPRPKNTPPTPHWQRNFPTIRIFKPNKKSALNGANFS